MLEKTAYIAMTKFLEDYWQRNGCPDEIGSLLGSMALQDDGMPADVAMWEEWVNACSQAEKELE